MAVATKAVASKTVKSFKASAKNAKGTAKTITLKVVKAVAKNNGKGKTTKLVYADIAKTLNVPLDERKALAIGRVDKHGKPAVITPRRFHIDPDKLSAMQAEYKDNPKKIPNAHNHGSYWLIIEALESLGKDKPHTFKALKTEMKRIGSNEDLNDMEGVTLWNRFANKEGRTDNDENNASLDERIHCNAYVLQRLGGMTPYGLKLLQTGLNVLKSKGCVIDILKGKNDERMYKLNTNSATPLNEFVRRSK